VNKDAREASEREEARGLRCPRCGCSHFYVVYIRAAQGGKVPGQKVGKHWRFHRETMDQRMTCGDGENAKRKV